MRYRYRVIPFIGQSKGSISPSEVASQLENVISEHAVDGWEFYQLSDVNIEVQPGCLAGLFGAKTQYMRFDQVIFRTEQRGSPSAPLATPTRPPSRSAPSATEPTPHKPIEESGKREPRLEAPGNINPQFLEVWQRKTDEELRRAASSLDPYTETGRQVILAELSRRGVALNDGDRLTYCYHCGADVQPESSVCTACGKSL